MRSTRKSPFLAVALAGVLVADPGYPQQPEAEPQASPVVAEAPPPLERPALEGLTIHPGGLTANEAARRALAASNGIRQKRAEVEAASARVRQTTFEFFPQLTLMASYTRLSSVVSDFGQGALVGALNAGPLTTGPCPGGGGEECVLDSQGQPVAATSVAVRNLQDNYALSASLSVPVSDYALRLASASASASASRDAAQYALSAEKLKVATDTKILYFNFLRAHLQGFNAEKALERNRARLADARVGFEAGTVAKADVLRFEALVANSELAVKRTETQLALTNTQLAIVMEDESPGRYRPGQGAGDATRLVVWDVPADRLVAEALRKRFEIKSLDAATRSLRKGASAVQSGALPRIDLVGNLTYANPNTQYFPPRRRWNETWSVGAVATWTVFDSFLNTARADELEANARATEAQRNAMEDAVHEEVVAAALDLSEAQTAVRSTDTALRAAEAAYHAMTNLYRAGRATTTDLIEAESELLAAKLGQTDARIDLKIADLRLRHATGRDVVGR